MINNYEVISLIPAKKYSSGLNNKNFKKINGLSLFEIATIASKKSKLIDHTYVSSDSEKILRISRKYNASLIKRSNMYCNKGADANSVILDFLKKIKKQKNVNQLIIVYLQPTSPFRNHHHINLSINEFINNKSKCLVSVVNIGTKFNKSCKIKKNKIIPLFKNFNLTANRQTFTDIFLPNGAIYIFYASDFLKKNSLNLKDAKPFIMNNFESLDIDDKDDYNTACKLSKKYLIYKKL
jgi:CMP-N,N'-diacetyllegionaminic acid synthase